MQINGGGGDLFRLRETPAQKRDNNPSLLLLLLPQFYFLDQFSRLLMATMPVPTPKEPRYFLFLSRFHY
jgi:hypothetical protein